MNDEQLLTAVLDIIARAQHVCSSLQQVAELLASESAARRERVTDELEQRHPTLAVIDDE